MSQENNQLLSTRTAWMYPPRRQPLNSTDSPAPAALPPVHSPYSSVQPEVSTYAPSAVFATPAVPEIVGQLPMSHPEKMQVEVPEGSWELWKEASSRALSDCAFAACATQSAFIACNRLNSACPKSFFAPAFSTCSSYTEALAACSACFAFPRLLVAVLQAVVAASFWNRATSFASAAVLTSKSMEDLLFWAACRNFLALSTFWKVLETSSLAEATAFLAATKSAAAWVLSFWASMNFWLRDLRISVILSKSLLTASMMPWMQLVVLTAWPQADFFISYLPCALSSLSSRAVAEAYCLLLSFTAVATSFSTAYTCTLAIYRSDSVVSIEAFTLPSSALARESARVALSTLELASALRPSMREKLYLMTFLLGTSAQTLLELERQVIGWMLKVKKASQELPFSSEQVAPKEQQPSAQKTPVSRPWELPSSCSGSCRKVQLGLAALTNLLRSSDILSPTWQILGTLCTHAMLFFSVAFPSALKVDCTTRSTMSCSPLSPAPSYRATMLKDPAESGMPSMEPEGVAVKQSGRLAKVMVGEARPFTRKLAVQYCPTNAVGGMAGAIQQWLQPCGPCSEATSSASSAIALISLPIIYIMRQYQPAAEKSALPAPLPPVPPAPAAQRPRPPPPAHPTPGTNKRGICRNITVLFY